MSLVADALRVLPDVTPSTSPEVLVKFELNDESEGTTLAPSVIPATPPLLGLSNPFITMDTVVYQESTGSASVESSASSSPSAKQFGDTIYSSASTSSIQTNQLALGPFESAELRLSISGDSESEVSLRRSDQENIWPAPALDLPDRITRAFSRRQMASGVIDQRLQLDLPVLSSSFSDCGYGFEAGSLGLSGNAFPYLDCYSQTGEPITPIDQVLHTPEFPPQVARYDRRLAYEQPRFSERDTIFFQPAACFPSLSQYETHPASHLFPPSVYSSGKPSTFNTCRAQNYSFPSSPLASLHPSIERSSPQPLSLGP